MKIIFIFNLRLLFLIIIDEVFVMKIINRTLDVSQAIDKSFRKKIEQIKRKRLAAKKIVSLEDFRNLKKEEKPKTILIVDDDELMRNGLKRILEYEGYKILLASDGLELSQVLEHTKLDIILLDINLPWVDGFELCQLIKEHHALKHIPVIFISARKSPEDIKKGFEVGGSEYLTKPFEIEQLTTILNKYLLKCS